MFITEKTAEICFPPELEDGSGERHWTHMRLLGFIPWLLVVYSWKHGNGDSHRSTVGLANELQLQELAKTKHAVIEEVNVVTPDHVNHLGRWALEPLVAIWEGTHPTEDYKAQVYVTSEGARYCLDDSIQHESALREKHLIYGCNS